jgi:hypothetical protein
MNIGVGCETGVIQFTSDMDTVNHALAAGEKHPKTIDVKMSTLDELLKDESPTVMKIDVEGYETSVLEGAFEILGKNTLHSVIMELNGSGSRYHYDELKIVKLMYDYGFKTYSYNPLSRTLISLDGKNQTTGNTLFIRNQDKVIDRLKNSPMVSVNGNLF